MKDPRLQAEPVAPTAAEVHAGVAQTMRLIRGVKKSMKQNENMPRKNTPKSERKPAPNLVEEFGLDLSQPFDSIRGEQLTKTLGHAPRPRKRNR